MPETTIRSLISAGAAHPRMLRARRGASLALVAISMTALTGVGALAIDLGMLYKARADALYAAEAGALAGASAFLDYADPFSLAARTEAADRAIEYARRNRILTSPVGADGSRAAGSHPRGDEGSGPGRSGQRRHLVFRHLRRIVGADLGGRRRRGAGGRCRRVRLAVHDPDIWDERR